MKRREERPIIFSTSMVNAILEGRKSQTRRIVKFKYLANNKIGSIHKDGSGPEETIRLYPGDEGFGCPYGQVGDTLWARETFAEINHPELKYRYKADHLNHKSVSWKPSIFMPKKACRIFLKITDIRVERLQEISEGDAIDEGVNRSNLSGDWEHTPSAEYEKLWININSEKSWDENPFVLVITFERTECLKGKKKY